MQKTLHDLYTQLVHDEVAGRLVTMRHRAKMTGPHLARVTYMSAAKISRFETGLRMPTLQEVDLLATATKVGEEERENLFRLVKGFHASNDQHLVMFVGSNWHTQYFFRELDLLADSFRCYQNTTVPALLQNAQYVQNIYSNWGGYADEVSADAIKARIARQNVLFDQSKQFSFLVTQNALRYRHCTNMHLQWSHIAFLASLSNVSLGIIPDAEAKELPDIGGFAVYGDFLITSEMLPSMTVYNEIDPVEVRRSISLYDRLSEFARWGTEAVMLLHEMIASESSQAVDLRGLSANN